MSEETGASGGSITVAQADQTMNLDPFTVPIGGRETRSVKRQIFDTLVMQDEELVPQPQLATEWSNPDDLTWVFTLRDDVTFHNGDEFNADTVKDNLDLVLDPNGGSPAHSKFDAMIDTVEVTGDFEVTVTTKDPAPSMLQQLAFQEIIPVSHREEVGAEEFNAAPVGTGPFSFVSQTKDSVTVERYDGYWGDVAKVDSVTFRHIPDVSARISALQAGEVDVIDKVPNDLAPTISGTAEAVSIPGTRVYYVGMNVEQAPFDDVKVRNALQQATDTTSLADNLYSGDAIALNQPAFPLMFGYQEGAAALPYDPAAAQEVLADISTPVTLNATQADLTLAQAVAGQWEQAGFQVSVQTLEDEAFTAETQNGDAQLFLSSWGVAEGDLDAIVTRHHWTERDDTSHFTNYSNPEADELIVAGRTTVDDGERMSIYSELVDLINSDAPWVSLVTPNEIYGVSTAVKGWTPSPTGHYPGLNLATVN